jgi:hypothetical protein
MWQVDVWASQMFHCGCRPAAPPIGDSYHDITRRAAPMIAIKMRSLRGRTTADSAVASLYVVSPSDAGGQMFVWMTVNVIVDRQCGVSRVVDYGKGSCEDCWTQVTGLTAICRRRQNTTRVRRRRPFVKTRRIDLGLDSRPIHGFWKCLSNVCRNMSSE